MRRAALTAVAALVLGCSQLTGPLRENIYDYRLVVNSADTLIFNWPRSTLPVRVYVAPDDTLRDDVETALARWQGVFLYGEFRATLASDSAHADIIVENNISPNGEGVPAFAPQCSGLTNIDTASTAFTIKLPIHIYVWPNGSVGGVGDCYRITMTHEMGHAIGLLRHSPNPGDVMYADPTIDGLSARDTATAQVLYHLTPTMVIGTRP